ncbi:hypothetical protein B0H14DRAFT_3867999 [Mycena olivaceomarginata]|nr:hypothetical protein B0H14DRAFT_3867999 [Mycena olivaceomarginata]
MHELLPAADTGTSWERCSEDPPTSTIASASRLVSVRKNATGIRRLTSTVLTASRVDKTCVRQAPAFPAATLKK